jgi:hypothetical protein
MFEGNFFSQHIDQFLAANLISALFLPAEVNFTEFVKGVGRGEGGLDIHPSCGTILKTGQKGSRSSLFRLLTASPHPLEGERIKY